MKGPFICYRGLSLSEEVIEKWRRKKILYLDGYNSTSLNKEISKKFAHESKDHGLLQVILEIHM